MPYASKAQQRYFFAAERAGKLPKGTALRWAHETKEQGTDLKKLPEHVTDTMQKKASLAKLSASGVNTATRQSRPRHAVGTSVGRIHVPGSPIIGTARSLSIAAQKMLSGKSKTPSAVMPPEA